VRRSDEEIEMRFREDGLFHEGSHMTANRARKLEIDLVANSADEYEIRLVLLGFYERRRYSKHESVKSHMKHLIWFIDNHPRQPLHENVCFVRDCPQFKTAKQHWLKQVEHNPDDINVLNNAAHHCFWISPRTAERLWKRAWELDPLNEEWPRQLCEHYMRQAKSVSPYPKHLLRKAIATGKAAIKLLECYPKESYLHYYMKAFVDDLTDLLRGDEFVQDVSELKQACARHREKKRQREKGNIS
jgi:hypothetical protein